jgi:hypothetical protein
VKREDLVLLVLIEQGVLIRELCDWARDAQEKVDEWKKAHEAKLAATDAGRIFVKAPGKGKGKANNLDMGEPVSIYFYILWFLR